MARETTQTGEAFARFVHERQGAIFALAYAKLGNSHDAEDVMQEVFVEVHRNFHRLNSHKNISGWLFKVTLNRCKDHWRKKSRRQRREMEFMRMTSAAAQRPTDDGLADTVLEVVGRLPEKYRIVIMLKHFAMLSYADISTMTGLSKTTIDGRLRTAKKEMKKAFIEMGLGVS